MSNFFKDKMVELDVRPEIDAGRDPFNSIMKAVSSLKEDEGLHLINVFEPVPLYTVMKMKGYDHTTESADGLWHIYFFKAMAEDTTQSALQGNKPQSGNPGTIELDVRGLEPPEPMVKIIETLPQIGKNSVLLVHHHREPVMLYDKLEHLGFEASAEKVSDGYYRIRITHKG